MGSIVRLRTKATEFVLFVCVMQRTGAAQSIQRLRYGLDIEESAIDCRQRMKFSLCTEFRPALGPIQPPTQWVLETVSPRVKRKGREADQYLQLVARARMM
jgi:hypothetical protein